MNKEQEHTLWSFLLMLTPWALGLVVSFQVYMFSMVLENQKALLTYQNQVSQTFVTKEDLRQDMKDIKETLREIREELKSKN